MRTGPAVAILGLVIGLTPGTTARGDLLLTGSGSGTQTLSAAGDTQGFSFVVGTQDLTVTSLGFLDIDATGPPDGLVESHDVGVWNNNSTPDLLGSVTVTASDPLIDGFRFADLASAVVLSAGQTYILGALYPTGSGGDLLTLNSAAQAAGIIDTSAATFDRGRVGAGSGSLVPGSPNAGIRVGPNLEFTAGEVSAAPEPSTMISVATGVLIMLGYAWRKRSKAMIAGA